MIKIKNLTVNDISPDMLLNFNHHQVITKKWVKKNGNWELTTASDLREWNREKRIWISDYFRQLLGRGGSVVIAFDKNILVGFCCVDGILAGNTAKYANMTMLFVDDNWKRKGIGKKLFERICLCAAKMKADKLFISAIPSFDTITFYHHMGCEDAKEIISEYVDTEQDRYLEFILTTTS
jgi:GNAT superfamily N-acetyltransferase